MNSIKTFVAVATLSLISFSSFAQTITATAGTLDDAEAQIAAQAHKSGDSYRITEATTKNCVHMTAELNK